MKREVYSYPKSAFLSVEKDMSIITNTIMKNDRLKKMLYYTSKDCLNKPNLNEDQTLELFGKNIKIVPKFYVDEEVLNYLFINFNNFSLNASNPEFRDNIIEFDIICHIDQWQMHDFELRPYKIAAEIDSMFNNRTLTGMGQLVFFNASPIIVSDEFIGVCLKYKTVHGGEDKYHMPNPNNEEAFKENFDKIFNEE